MSEEGTTQGDPLAMPMYALATIPLIDQLGDIHDVTQVWYADDASAAGSLPSIRMWWDRITSLGPAYGYHANACKMWLIAKEQHLSKAKELFNDTDIRITSRGRPYLGTPLVPEEFTEEFVTKKVQEWSEQLLELANIATTQPHATFTAFGHGYVHKFTYLSRVTPNIDLLLQPLEDIIQSRLIPAWTGRAPPNAIERDLFTLPACFGRLGIVNLPSCSSSEFSNSVKISSPLTDLILIKSSNYPCMGCPGSTAVCKTSCS